MSSLDFDAGNVGPLARGLLQSIFDRSCGEIQDRKVNPGKGELNYVAASQILDKNWESAWESPEGKILRSAMMQGHLPPEQCQCIQDAKARLLAGLVPYIRSEKAEEKPGDAKDDDLSIRDGYYWNLMKEQLKRKFSRAVVDSIDMQSNRVMKRILFSGEENEFRKMGLVLGQVQSGKTANYSALIAKACDCGYRVIIVLSGVHNDLRRQTQERLDEEFLGYHEYLYRNENGRLVKLSHSEPCGVGLLPGYDRQKAPRCATFTDDDFKGSFQTGVGKDAPLLFVVKKNWSVFDKLIKYFENGRYKDWPLLLIDDEADQASINTGRPSRTGVFHEDIVSTTNGCIRRLLELFPKASFVGYTATPFANVLIDARVDSPKFGVDLFPRDFILALPAPPNYFGPASFFGDNRSDEGLDLFIPVSDKSSDILTGEGKKRVSQVPRGGGGQKLPDECRVALLQFILSTAIRVWRDRRNHPENWRRENPDEDVPERQPVLKSSMLVHFSSRIKAHKSISAQFRDLVLGAARDVVKFGDEQSRAKLWNDLERMFEDQRQTTARIRKDAEDWDYHPLYPEWGLPETFEDLRPLLHEVIEDLSIVVVNGELQAKEILCRSPGLPGRKFVQARIFIGGNKLSRGLTLPGLCVSFFLRSSTMYDTLLQMGRWFGYREGYIDLCRICTTTKIFDRFRAISEACLDLAYQIDRMAYLNQDPDKVRLKILQHPGLLVTARNKLGASSEGFISFNGETLECRNLDLTTEGLVENWSLASDLYSDLTAHGCGRLAYASADYPDQGEEKEASTREDVRNASGRVWRDVPAETVLNFVRGYRSHDNEGDQYKKGVISYIENELKDGDLTRWNVFIPGRYSSEEKVFNVRFVQRAMSIPKTDPSSGVLRVLKTGSHEFVGVPADVMKVAVENAGTGRGELFKAVRKAAGQLRPEEGYLILYLMEIPAKDLSNDQYFRSARKEINATVPVVSYYLWLPRSRRNSQTNMARFNTSIRNEDPDDDYVEPVMEDDE